MTATDRDATDEPLIVTQSSFWLFVRALGAFAFVGLCGVVVPGGIFGDPPRFLSLIFVFGIVFFGFAGVLWVFKSITTLLRSQPALVIDREGLHDRSSALAAGQLFWDDIERITVTSVMGTPMLAVSPIDVDAYCARQHLLKRVGMRINLVLIGSPVAIAFTNLPVSSDDLLDAIDQYHPIDRPDTR